MLRRFRRTAGDIVTLYVFTQSLYSLFRVMRRFRQIARGK